MEEEAFLLPDDKLEKVAYVLKTIGHPVRLKIISLLANNDHLSVNDIGEACDLEQSLISHHLNNMKLKGILHSQREGKSIYYGIKLEEVLHVIRCMKNCNL